MISSLILSLLVSASGDPYARCLISDHCGITDVQLTTAQRTQVVNHVTSQPEWSSIPPASILRFQCDLTGTPARCRPWYESTQTGETIRTWLLAGNTWTPGVGTMTSLEYGSWKYYTGALLTALTNHVYNVAPSINGLPLLEYDVGRTNGSGVLYGSIGYKAVADATWCAANAGETLVPAGVVP